MESLKIHNVSIKPSEEDAGDELSKTFYRSCSFCDKLVRVSSFNFKSCLNLGGKKFFCPFCLRNNLHFRSSRHTLILSYRAIIGHLYHNNYLKMPNGGIKLWVNQIRIQINNHERMGLRSPVFCYDPETYLWYIDFTRVGKENHKAPCEEIIDTAMTILRCFDLDIIYGQWAFNDVWTKYEKSINIFYQQRKRPKNKRMLIPSLNNLNNSNDNVYTREFLPIMLQLK